MKALMTVLMMIVIPSIAFGTVYYPENPKSNVGAKALISSSGNTDIPDNVAAIVPICDDCEAAKNRGIANMPPGFRKGGPGGSDNSGNGLTEEGD